MSLFKIHKSPLFIRIVFVLAIFLMLFVSALTYRHVESINVSTDAVEHTYKVSIEIEDLFNNIKNLEIERRNFLLTKNEKLPQLIAASKNRIISNLERISILSKDNIEQTKRATELNSLLLKKFEIVDNALENHNSYSTNELKSNLLEGRIYMEKISLVIHKMLANERKLLVKKDLASNSLTDSTPKIIFITLFSTIAIISLAFIKINRDLEEMRVSKELLQLNDESNNLAEIVGNYGTWFYNLSSNDFRFSDNKYKLLGIDKASFTDSQMYYDCIHPDDVAFVKEESAKMKENGYLKPITFRIIKPNGEQRIIRNLANAYKNNTGDTILIGTSTDVTEQVEAQKIVEDRNRELEASNKELQAFNYVASHDLQEPLRKIQTFISRLIEKDLSSLSANGQQYVQKIHESSERMRSLIDDLLQFSRTNKSEKIFETTNFNDVLEASKQDLTQIIESKKATLLSDTLPITQAIPFQIQQLFTNLISNSLKYAKEDEPPVLSIKHKIVTAENEVLIDKKDKTKYYKITFEDNGIGFDNEYAEKIFVLFNRLHNREAYSGTGIGLSICKKIIDNHKGFIFAEGTQNKGAIFTLFFPIHPTDILS